MNGSQTINLFLEETGRSEQPDRLEVPEGVSYVMVDGDGRPVLGRDLPEDVSSFMLIEQIHWDRAARLVLLNMGSDAPMVNGKSAPPVVLLGEGDEVVFGRAGGFVAHVTVFSRPVFGPPPENEIGNACPICLVNFSAESRTYICPVCGKPTHCDSEEEPGTRLCCAMPGRKCPVCRTPMTFDAGFTYIPEFCRGH